jgi:DNA-binding SARP family transcriptional activator/tetratricopeptide (TPR) repeat protein
LVARNLAAQPHEDLNTLFRRGLGLFQLNVFGSPQLMRGGDSPVHFRTKKHLAVLLYLHLEGRTRSIPRDRLVDLLWPEVSPEKGRHSLSQALLAIRSRLGTDAVTGREHDVQLLAELPSDLSALRQGQVATVRVEEPLRGLDECGGAEFAHWVDGARVRLKAQARDALRAALQAARAKGNLSETHRVATALYDVDRLCTDAVSALAERALLDGDTVAAVRLLQEHLQRAQAELGTNPNPEFARLLRRLERGERPVVPPQTSPLTGRPQHRFMGREVELGQLEATWNRVAVAGYQTSLVSGAPGIGKSELVRRFATLLEARAWPVFVVSCQEIGQGIPYATIAELITALGRDPAASGTDPLWLAEASRVCPGLRTIYPGIPTAPDAPTESIRLRVAEAVVRMMEAVADNGPVLLAFDDLQFVDPASREVLFLVTRRLERIPTFILAGARAGDAGGMSWQETIHLQPLDRSQAMSLVHELSADSEELSSAIRETIVRLAQGNPYHMEMLLADWHTHKATSLVAAESSGDIAAISWTPPEDLRTAFARQYGGLSSDVQHVLQVLAVAGKSMAPSELGSLLGLQGGVVERAALEMLDRGVGRVEGGRLSFKNELHRAYVYHAMADDRRKYHHAQLAHLLSASPDRDHLQPMLELVHHFTSAGMQQQATETALQAAEVAIARGAPREAERVLTRLLRAYAVPPGSRLRLLLAHSLVAAGQYQRGLDALAEWRPDAASSTDLALAALLRALALQRARLGSDESIIAAAQEAVVLADRADAASFLVRANHIRFEVSVDAGDLRVRAEVESLAARIAASGATPESVALANLTLGHGALARGELVQGVERLTEAAAVLESLALLVELRLVLNTLGICYKGLGRFEEATRTLSEAVTVAERCGHPGAIGHSRMALANLYHDLAFFESSVRCIRATLAPLEALASPRASVEAYSSIARLAVALGSGSEAETAAERCEEGAQRSGLWRHRVTALMTRAEVYLYNRQPELAWPLVEEAALITRDRSHQLPDAGLYERLQRQFYRATRGYEAMKSLDRPIPTALFDSLVDALEVRLFDEAVALIAADKIGGRAPALEEAVTTGLLGPLARLLAVGVHHPGVPQRLPGESAAELIARAFPHAERTVVPRSIGLLSSR